MTVDNVDNHVDDQIEIIGPECKERFVSHEKVPGLAGCNIRIAGASRLKGQYKIAHRRPSMHTLIYTFSGRGALEVGDREYIINSNTLTFLPVNQAHCFYITAGYWKTAWLCVENIGLPGVELSRDYFVTAYGHCGFVYHLLNALYFSEGRSEQSALLDMLLSCIKESFSDVPQKPSSLHQTQELFRMVNESLHVKWNMKEMAKVGHYSPAHLHRLCMANYGRSPMQQVMHLRMERAKELLLNTRWSVSKIASIVGYTDEFNFSTRFKKHVGQPPTHYRASNSALL